MASSVWSFNSSQMISLGMPSDIGLSNHPALGPYVSFCTHSPSLLSHGPITGIFPPATSSKFSLRRISFISFRLYI